MIPMTTTEPMATTTMTIESLQETIGRQNAMIEELNSQLLNKRSTIASMETTCRELQQQLDAAQIEMKRLTCEDEDLLHTINGSATEGE